MTEVEVHRPTATDRIPAAGLSVDVTTDAAECAAVAARLGIPGVKRLVCQFKVFRPPQARGGEIVAEGHLRATLMRECVVSLEPFKVSVEERFRVRFVPCGMEAVDDDPESDDEIGYDGTAIDLGEAAVEQLALTLDPYPRKPGAALPPEASDEPSGPFAGLEGLARLVRPS
jgi:uncharacterized metal-binding protein YceD (DUF177 family)